MPLYRIVGFVAASLCSAHKKQQYHGRQGCLLDRTTDVPTELECNDEGGSAHLKPNSTMRSPSLIVFPRWMGTDWGWCHGFPRNAHRQGQGQGPAHGYAEE